MPEVMGNHRCSDRWRQRPLEGIGSGDTSALLAVLRQILSKQLAFPWTLVDRDCSALGRYQRDHDAQDAPNLTIACISSHERNGTSSDHPTLVFPLFCAASSFHVLNSCLKKMSKVPSGSNQYTTQTIQLLFPS